MTHAVLINHDSNVAANCATAAAAAADPPSCAPLDPSACLPSKSEPTGRASSAAASQLSASGLHASSVVHHHHYLCHLLPTCLPALSLPECSCFVHLQGCIPKDWVSSVICGANCAAGLLCITLLCINQLPCPLALLNHRAAFPRTGSAQSSPTGALPSQASAPHCRKASRASS
jgi:hypothetical protein